jgi:hypothetical protein
MLFTPSSHQDLSLTRGVEDQGISPEGGGHPVRARAITTSHALWRGQSHHTFAVSRTCSGPHYDR